MSRAHGPQMVGFHVCILVLSRSRRAWHVACIAFPPSVATVAADRGNADSTEMHFECKAKPDLTLTLTRLLVPVKRPSSNFLQAL